MGPLLLTNAVSPLKHTCGFSAGYSPLEVLPWFCLPSTCYRCPFPTLPCTDVSFGSLPPLPSLNDELLLTSACRSAWHLTAASSTCCLPSGRAAGSLGASHRALLALAGLSLPVTSSLCCLAPVSPPASPLRVSYSPRAATQGAGLTRLAALFAKTRTRLDGFPFFP